MPEYAPAPWQVWLDSRVGSKHDTYSVHTPGGRVIAVIRDGFGEQEANARLVASAPELLETLSDLIAVVETYADAWDPDTDLWDTRRLASEAERKARGMESIHD